MAKRPGHVVFDPDTQVQETVRLLFHTFERTGSLNATVKYFRREDLLYPTRVALAVPAGASSPMDGAGGSVCRHTSGTC